MDGLDFHQKEINMNPHFGGGFFMPKIYYHY